MSTTPTDAPEPTATLLPAPEPPAPVLYRGFTLDGFQAQAVAALAAGESVLVSAPTGTGKTLVADWLVEKTLQEGKEVIFTAPIKALSNQKFRDYCRILGDDRVGLVTGDLVIRRDAPCRVMTTEILRNMLLSGEKVEQLGCVIVDEIHFLDDKERGTTWEEVLIYLPRHVQIVGLSATLSNLHEFAAWLAHVRDRPVRVVEERRRAVPLEFAVASRDGRLARVPEMRERYQRWAKKNAGRIQEAEERGGRRSGHRGRKLGISAPTRHGDVFELLWPNLAPYLYFVFSRRDTENMARSLARTVEDSLLTAEQIAEVDHAIRAFAADPNAAAAIDRDLFDIYRKGIAFHHAGLHVGLKALVEELYERRLIQVLYCTGTFALGINMPARTAVFDGLERFDGTSMIPLPAREFMQMAGRAGRRGMDEAGLVVTRCDMDEWPALEGRLKRYIEGHTEPVQSKFGLSFNSVVNLLNRQDPDQIRTLVERSFLAWHRSARAREDARKADQLFDKLQAAGWSLGDKPPTGMKSLFKDWKIIRGRADTGPAQTWAEFEDRVTFLKSWGYIAEDGSFNAGAKAVLQLQISEIFVAECFLAGIFDEIDEDTLFGVAAGMCAEFPRGANPKPDRRDKGLVRQLDEIRGSEIVRQAEELTGVRVSWDPQMIPFGRAWAQGRQLTELMQRVDSNTDVSGDLIGAFRRARDVVGQVAGLYAHDPDKRKALEEVCRKVRRDEVEVVD